MTPHAVVIGGGPAGLSAALGLRRAGWRASVLEQRDRWLGRVCGAFLDGEAERHLRWLGVWEAVSGRGSRIRRVRIGTATGREQTVAMPAPVLAVSRFELEEILHAAALAQGVDARNGVRAVERALNPEGCAVRTSLGDRLQAQAVVIAAGRFADGTPSGMDDGWYGWSADFCGLGQAADELTMFFYPGGYVGGVVFPDGVGHLCGLARRRGGSLDWAEVYDRARRLAPGFARLTQEASRAGPWRGVGPLPFTRSLKSSGKEIRVGDAAAVGDPFMGEGIGRALAAGPMIHEAIRMAGPAADPATAYAGLWQRAYRARFAAGRLLRAALSRDRLAGAVLEILVRRPAWIRRMLPLFHGGFRGGE